MIFTSRYSTLHGDRYGSPVSPLDSREQLSIRAMNGSAAAPLHSYALRRTNAHDLRRDSTATTALAALRPLLPPPDPS
jgi:hypothetical protein